MASGIELAKAYVQIVPSAEGIEAALEGEISGPAKEAGEKGGEEAGSAFGNFFKAGLKAVGAVATAAVTGAATAISGLTKSAVENFAEYEQFTGGVETLFKNNYKSIEEFAAAADISVQEATETWERYNARAGNVIENAKNAYKTAGISANEYMDTVTSFAAALVSSLGQNTAQAAEHADQAIIDMADNANKMGTSMESIQNAYQGFAKGNYTMLDNLKLGYGGTQKEMVRLINDSGVLYHEIESMDGIGFDTILQAIHAVQENMGISGATAAEASTTIQGSIGMAKAAWENLLTGMADPDQNLGVLIGNMVESVVTVGKNIIPRIAETLPRVIEGIQGLLEALIPELPTILGQILPALSEGAVQLVASLTEILPDLVNTVIEAFPMDQLMTIITSIGEAIIEMLPVIGDAGIQLVMTLVDYAIENAPTFIPEMIQIITDMAEKLTDGESLGKILEVALTLINSIVEGLLNSIPVLLEAIPELITSFCDFLASDSFDDLLASAGDIIVTLGKGLIEAIPELLRQIPTIIKAILRAFANIFEGILDVGYNIVAGLWQGLSNATQWIKDLIKGWVGNVLGFIKRLFGISSPSKEMAYFGKMLDYGLAVGIQDNMRPIRDAMRGVADMTTGTLNSEIAVRGSLRTGDTAYGSMGTLIGAVEGLGRKMEQMQVVLDSGVMIGTVDMGIGRNTARAERGVAYA